MIEIRTPTRLHFGLLAYGGEAARQFGGAGLMVRRPEVVVRVEADHTPDERGWRGFKGVGRMSDRAVEFAERFAAGAAERGWTLPAGAVIEVVRVPRPHTGLGSGTQLALAVGRALLELRHQGPTDPTNAETLAQLVGRGKRSGIGTHGFFHGGFIVDGGKAEGSPISPMVMRHAFPEAWRVVLIRPRSLEGMAGPREVQAFKQMPAIPPEVTARMAHLILMGLAPALLERDLNTFGEALYDLQQTVGQCFAAAQGGVHADPLLDRIVSHLRGAGVRGVGQSSWGPTLYALAPDAPSAERIADDVESAFGLTQPGEVIVTEADNQGATVRHVTVRA